MALLAQIPTLPWEDIQNTKKIDFWCPNGLASILSFPFPQISKGSWEKKSLEWGRTTRVLYYANLLRCSRFIGTSRHASSSSSSAWHRRLRSPSSPRPSFFSSRISNTWFRRPVFLRPSCMACLATSRACFRSWGLWKLVLSRCGFGTRRSSSL